MTLTNIIENYIFSQSLRELDLESPLVINTLNAHSYCILKEDNSFLEALLRSDVLLADGISIVIAARVLNGKKVSKIAGADLHSFLLEHANSYNKKVFYLGSTRKTLDKIESNINIQFPNIKFESFSPPYKDEFSDYDNEHMISAINLFKPDLLFIGMTAPKQEKWLEQNKNKLDVKVLASIGAVFDFYGGNISRAPDWMLKYGLEWLFRLIKEPRRLWRRYLINNFIFMGYVLKEYFLKNKI